MVVGLGNSGADIAVDGVRFAESVELSIRRGYHILPKFGFFGEATDVLYHKLLSPMPLRFRHYLAGLTVRLLTGSSTRYGMPKPDHPIFYTHPLVNSELLYHIRPRKDSSAAGHPAPGRPKSLLHGRVVGRVRYYHLGHRL